MTSRRWPLAPSSTSRSTACSISQRDRLCSWRRSWSGWPGSVVSGFVASSSRNSRISPAATRRVTSWCVRRGMTLPLASRTRTGVTSCRRCRAIGTQTNGLASAAPAGTPCSPRRGCRVSIWLRVRTVRSRSRLTARSRWPGSTRRRRSVIRETCWRRSDRSSRARPKAWSSRAIGGGLVGAGIDQTTSRRRSRPGWNGSGSGSAASVPPAVMVAAPAVLVAAPSAGPAGPVVTVVLVLVVPGWSAPGGVVPGGSGEESATAMRPHSLSPGSRPVCQVRR